LRTVDLLVLTGLDLLLFILKILFNFFCKTSYLNEEINCTDSSPSVSGPWSLFTTTIKGTVQIEVVSGAELAFH